MNRKEHAVMISTFLAVAFLFMFSVYTDIPSGNVVYTSEKLELVNCVVKDNFKICDVQYNNGEYVEEGFMERV
jgi:hypothetical protein